MNKFTTLQFVDSVKNANPVLSNNLLFRGGMPTDNGAFDLSDLDAAFRREYSQVPASYYLVDISLVFDLEPGLAVERAYFRDPTNANVGQLVWWPTWGSLRCYYQTNQVEQSRLVTTLDEWLPDTLIRRTETLRYMLETSWAPGWTPYDPGYNLPGTPSPPCVFYVHCDGGCDRTGEIIGAYRLRYNSYSWLQMYNEQPCGRPLGCSNYRALQWYAMWLNQTFSFNLVPNGDAGCWDGYLNPACVPPPPPQR